MLHISATQDETNQAISGLQMWLVIQQLQRQGSGTAFLLVAVTLMTFQEL